VVTAITKITIYWIGLRTNINLCVKKMISLRNIKQETTMQMLRGELVILTLSKMNERCFRCRIMTLTLSYHL